MLVVVVVVISPMQPHSGQFKAENPFVACKLRTSDNFYK